jgi:hypothetical protein
MTSWIGLLSVFADVAILLVLAAAVASPRVSSLARPVIATLAFACAWLATAVFDAMRAPGWTIVLGGAVIVVSIVLITASLHMWTQETDGSESGPGHRCDHGGGGPGRRRPDAPRHGGGGSDPSWWPEFDRQLALYVAECESRSVARELVGRRLSSRWPPRRTPPGSLDVQEVELPRWVPCPQQHPAR